METSEGNFDFVYKVYDTIAGCYFVSRGGKSIWTKKGAATAAVTTCLSFTSGAKIYGVVLSTRFEDQDRLVIHKFILERVDDE